MQLPAHADAGSLAVGSWRVSVSLRPASAHLRMGRSTVAQAFASRSFAGVAQPAGGVPVLLVFHPRRGQPVLFGRVSTGPGGWFHAAVRPHRPGVLTVRVLRVPGYAGDALAHTVVR